MLKLKNIKKDYIVAGNPVHALRGVSINFRANEFVSVLGPSGCGKTTLLNIIGGLDKYTSGDLIINGKSTKQYNDRDWDVYRNHRVGFVFQSYNLIPHQTVLGNVELALTISGMSKEERRKKAAAALDKVGLTDQISKYPNQLSGGQCQRVAIARALVNDPEILLADEPTGALDSKTSVQIMDLIKEIARERLVIMVTHNPELAQQYSTRIVRLVDGLVVSDSNPYSAGAELDEVLGTTIGDLDKKIHTEGQAVRRNGHEKAKMGFFTAFMLSLRNLLTKKGRTIMTGVAGSIGIIGVAVVLAFSSGITGYISSMENDMLSGFPISISTNAIDFSAILSLTNTLTEEDDASAHLPNKIYVNQIVKTLTSISNISVTNDITRKYIDFLEDMPTDYYDAMQYRYGINYANNIYTQYSYGNVGRDEDTMSITGIRNVFGAVLSEIDTYSAYSGMINSVAAFAELPDSQQYIEKQYDIVKGIYPEKADKNALVLVLSGNDEIDDLMLAQMGYVSQREFMNYAYFLAEEGGNEYFQSDVPHMAEPYDYSNFIGDSAKTFMWYPNNSVYKASTDKKSYTYQTYKTDVFTGGELLEVKCILRPKTTVQYGSLSAGMYHTKALTNHILDVERDETTRSDITTYAMDRKDDNGGNTFSADNIKFSYRYYTDKKVGDNINRDVPQEKINQDFGSNSSSEMSGDSGGSLGNIASIMPEEMFVQMIKGMLVGSTAEEKLDFLIGMIVDAFYHSSAKVVSLRELGGNDLPSRIYFYTDNFDTKDLLTGYLDSWNDFANGYITEETEKITYTDTIGLVMSMVNMLIMMVTIGLVSFTALALVVSTVMIGIITYVSVVERIKEIGVIRALGGSKRDVKNLFMAETFILGLGSGIIGIVVTYLISFIFNMALGAATGIFTIASLPWWQALVMIGISVILTLVSGLMPASSAAKKDPVVALRTE